MSNPAKSPPKLIMGLGRVFTVFQWLFLVGGSVNVVWGAVTLDGTRALWGLVQLAIAVPGLALPAASRRALSGRRSWTITTKTFYFCAAANLAVCGLGMAAIGLWVGGGYLPFLVALGACTVALGVALVVMTLRNYGPTRRIPGELVPEQQSVATPYTLHLRDGRRITAIAILPGGYLRPRSTDPAFDARDVVRVEPASAEDLDAERRRQAGESGHPPETV